MSKSTFFLLAILIIVATGAAAQDCLWFPLVPGLTHGYVPTGYGGEPHVVTTVEGVTEFRGATVWSVLHTYVDISYYENRFYFHVDDDGDLMLHGRRYNLSADIWEEVYTPPLRVIDAGAVQGLTWSQTVDRSYYLNGEPRGGGELIFEGRVLGMDIPIVVQAGVFRTMATVISRGGTVEIRNWYAEDVGMVMGQELVFSSAGNTWDLADDPLVPVDQTTWSDLKARFR